MTQIRDSQMPETLQDVKQSSCFRRYQELTESLVTSTATWKPQHKDAQELGTGHLSPQHQFKAVQRLILHELILLV